MRKKATEVETTQEQPSAPQSYNPFIASVNEKSYTQMNVQVGAQQLNAPIPEPSIQGNVVSGNEDAYNMLNSDFGNFSGGTQKESKSSSFNPSMNDVSDADKKMGAEHMAKLIVDGYEQLHDFANKGLQISERKLRKLVSEGEIDLQVDIPYDYGKTITAGEFIQDFNEQNKDTLSVSKEFKKEVTPVLTRVLQKRGAGVTDEQYLLYLFGKDILVKGVIFTQIRGTMTDMLGVIKEYTAAIKENGEVPVSKKSENNNSTTNPTSNPKTRSYESSSNYETSESIPENMNRDDFNFMTNETVMQSSVQKHEVPESGKARLMEQKKLDKEMAIALEKAKSLNQTKVSYEDAIKGKQTGKRGRKTKDYLSQVDESQIAEAIILSETKNNDTNKIDGLE